MGLGARGKNQGEQSLGRITSDAQEVEAKGSRVSSGPLASLSYRQTPVRCTGGADRGCPALLVGVRAAAMRRRACKLEGEWAGRLWL